MSGGPTQTTTQGFALSPEARDALNRELNFFQQYAQPAQNAAQAQVLSFLGTPRADQGRTPTAQPLLHTAQIPAAALERAAADTDLHPETLQSHIDTLRTSAPGLLDILRQTAEQYSGKTDSLVDPRFSKFLAPVSTTDTDTDIGSGAKTATGVGAAAVVASAAIAI